MSDDTSQRGPKDGKQIHVNEDYELAYWTKELGVDTEELIKLVDKHGTSAEAVRKALEKKE